MNDSAKIPEEEAKGTPAEEEDIEFYGDERIASKDAPVRGWLKFSYVFWIIFGLFWFYYFFNGSYGWLDRGYWLQLQRAALTTYPTETIENLSK